MTFTPGVPFDGQSLLNSKPMVRGNFTSLYDTVNENHYPPNDANQGDHKKAVFINDSTTTPTTTTEVALFPETYDSELQLMYRPPDQSNSEDKWPACPQIRAYGRFDSAGTLIGHSLNCSITFVSAGEFTVTFTTPFPVGALPADQDKYFVIGHAQRGAAQNTRESDITFYDITSSGFTLATNSASNYIAFVVYGG